MTRTQQLDKTNFDYLKKSDHKIFFGHTNDGEYLEGDKLIFQHEREEFELVVSKVHNDLPALRKGYSLLLLSEPTN